MPVDSSQEDIGGAVPTPKRELFASGRRNQEFHTIFRSIPLGEHLIDTFSCALNKEILVHGRLYLSAFHLCFNANILGWVTNVVIVLQDVVAVEKKMTAFVIPNAIQISTLHHRYFFASFMWRDEAYEKILMVWKNALSENRNDEFKKLKVVDVFGDDQPLVPRSRSGRYEDSLAEQYSSIASKADASDDSSYLKDVSEDLDEQGQVSDGTMPCGCYNHYEHTVINQTYLAPVSWLSERLLGEAAGSQTFHFLLNLFHSMGMEDIQFEPWRAGTDLSERRKLRFRLLFSRLIPEPNMVQADVTEVYLLKQSTRHVVESFVVLGGVPCGTCFIKLRYCLTLSSLIRSRLLVTAKTYPPKESWFKESIRQALLDKWTSIFQSIDAELRKDAQTTVENGSSAKICEDNGSNIKASSTVCSTERKGTTELPRPPAELKTHFDMNSFQKSVRRWFFLLVMLMVVFLAAWLAANGSRRNHDGLQREDIVPTFSVEHGGGGGGGGGSGNDDAGAVEFAVSQIEAELEIYLQSQCAPQSKGLTDILLGRLAEAEQFFEKSLDRLAHVAAFLQERSPNDESEVDLLNAAKK